MELLVNDLSVHEQFTDVQSFIEAFDQLVAMRKVAQSLNLKVYRNQRFLEAKITPEINMQMAIKQFPHSKRMAALSWLTGPGGPFWDNPRQHSPDDWLEWEDADKDEDKIVTDTAVGEAAYRYLNDGTVCGLLSFKSCKWNIPYVRTIWCYRDEPDSESRVEIPNWWDSCDLRNDLENITHEMGNSWGELSENSSRRFQNLTFADDCFDFLSKPLLVPFHFGLCQKIWRQLEILDEMAMAFDVNGGLTREGELLYQKHFRGKTAWFSDSSGREKNEYRDQLTFRHPEHGHGIFCPWHGKPRPGGKVPIRIHFHGDGEEEGWPLHPSRPTYVVYIGPKLTM